MEVTLDPGRIGVWTGLLDSLPAARAVETVAELESMGYGAVWIPETVGRDALLSKGMVAFLGALLVGGIVVIAASFYSSDRSAEATRVWSSAHGHWHDAGGQRVP